MILDTITILALFVAIIFLIILIVKPVEKFSFFVFDAKLKQKVDVKNAENRKLNIQNNLIENDIRKRKTIDQIEEEVNKYENVLTFIKENINNIPVCREIDLRTDLRPTCENRAISTCTLNSFCSIVDGQCVNKELNPECADVFFDSNGNRLDKASKMFVYPTVLEEIS